MRKRVEGRGKIRVEKRGGSRVGIRGRVKGGD